MVRNGGLATTGLVFGASVAGMGAGVSDLGSLASFFFLSRLLFKIPGVSETGVRSSNIVRCISDLDLTIFADWSIGKVVSWVWSGWF